jgi:hypothetical protein
MVSRGCGNSSVKERRQKAGSIVRKYQKQGRHSRFFNVLLFAPALAPNIFLKNLFALHLRARHNISKCAHISTDLLKRVDAGPQKGERSTNSVPFYF